MILIRRTSLLLFFAISSLLLVGQDKGRDFNEDAMEQFSESREFAYMHMTPKPVSLWDQIVGWFIYQWTLLMSKPLSSVYTWILLALLIIGFGIFWMTRLRYRSAVVKNETLGGAGFVEQAVHTIDYRFLIQNALDERRFKEAVRFLYLQALVNLSKNGLISFQEWKTPYDYQAELPKDAQEPYSRLALLFEYCWYGDFDVKRSDFDKGVNYVQLLDEQVN